MAARTSLAERSTTAPKQPANTARPRRSKVRSTRQIVVQREAGRVPTRSSCPPRSGSHACCGPAREPRVLAVANAAERLHRLGGAGDGPPRRCELRDRSEAAQQRELVLGCGAVLGLPDQLGAAQRPERGLRRSRPRCRRASRGGPACCCKRRGRRPRAPARRHEPTPRPRPSAADAPSELWRRVMFSIVEMRRTPPPS